MKKILLSALILIASICGYSQAGVVFNEFYPNPGISNNDPTKFNHEYFELYNTTGNFISLDCYTVLAYDNVHHTAYVYQFQNGLSIAPAGFMVFTNSVTNPLTIRTDNLQNPTVYSGSNIVSWNQTDGSTGSLQAYTKSGANLTPTGGNLNNVNDFLLDPGSGDGIAIFLFNGTTMVNGFIGSGNPVLPSDFASITNFVIPATTGCAGGSVNLSAITSSQVELQSVTASTGSDNGYYRTTNGLCGTWKKSSTADQTTPGVTNGGAEAGTFATVTALPTCFTPNAFATTWNASIQITNSIYLTSTYWIYDDKDFSHSVTLADGAPLFTGTINDLNVHSFPNIVLGSTHDLLIQVAAAQNCLIFFRAFSSGCIVTPVSFKSFTAARNHSTVGLKWETAFEQNNSGFAIERNIGGTWEQVAFVPSQAADGNSGSALSYQYNDLNNVKGITQYRLRQVDFDAKSKYSEIRAVRGEGQAGNTVVYPNPSFDGRVSVVFEDATVARDASLSDMAGRILKQWKGITNNNIQIDNLVPGMYTLRIVVPETGEQSVQKIIVSKR